jgi:hypothetical protein
MASDFLIHHSFLILGINRHGIRHWIFGDWKWIRPGMVVKSQAQKLRAVNETKVGDCAPERVRMVI